MTVMGTSILTVGLIATTFSAVRCYTTISHHRGIRATSLSAQLEASKDDTTPFKVKLAGGIINALFSVKPLFKFASGKARDSMVQRGASIGVDWVENVSVLEKDIDKLTKLFDGVKDKKLEYPDYYLKPFHAYEEGNLSWQVYDTLLPQLIFMNLMIISLIERST